MSNENQNNNKTNSFDQGENQDVKNFHSKSSQWSFCRNGSNFSNIGDLYSVGSEPANKLCIKTPYTIIGFIYLFADTWAVFSADRLGNSEIGRFVEGTCTYTKVVNDPCLKFNQANLIIGVAKENHDCSWHIYWADGLNPDRTMNFDKPPYVQSCTTTAGCITCVDTAVLNCDALRLARLVSPPCVRVIKGASGGNLLNGSYFVVISYLVNGQRVTDYFTPSNVQSLFDHSNVAGSIDVIIDSMDKRFDEFELVVISIVNQQTQAKNFGIYNTRQKHITIDIIDSTLTDVPISQIPLHNPIANKSDGIYEVGNYMVRVGPTNKFDFNYQPLANQIVAKWQSIEYPSDYYRKGGNKTSYLRDENYPFFIQWEYDDGDFSASYHIPGRPPFPAEYTGGVFTGTNFVIATGPDADVEASEGIVPWLWMVKNTATPGIFINPSIPTDDGGFIIMEGYMGYWESTEQYPDNKPLIYNASTFGAFLPPYPGTGLADYDLCGKKIRHHKFPEQSTSPYVVHFGSPAAAQLPGGIPAINGDSIRIMGVKFENIKQPLMNDGVTPVPGIVGYRILRGSREGNKTIVAKGMFNNMFQYDIEGGVTTRKGLYPNYPYNDLNADPYISQSDTSGDNGAGAAPNGSFKRDRFTFHSPDTQFRHPFLSMKEVKIYGENYGMVDGNFVIPDKHPQHKFITDFAFIASAIAGLGIASIAMNGERRTTNVMPQRAAFIDRKGATTFTGTFAGVAGVGTQTSLPGLGGLLNLVTAADMAAGKAASSALVATLYGTNTGYWTAGGQIGSNLGGNDMAAYTASLASNATAASNLNAMSGYVTNVEQTAGNFDHTPLVFRVANALPTFTYFWSQGTDATLKLIKALIQWDQFALQYQSHCYYNGWVSAVSGGGNTRRLIKQEIYLDNQLQDFGTIHRINNLFRGKSVAIQTTKNVGLTSIQDNSRQTLGSAQNLGLANPPTYVNPTIPFTTTSSCHYGALKNRLRNQYGQIGGVRQIPIHSCLIDTSTKTFPYKSSIIFGGDTYVSRYTEKNTMFFFYDWLYGQPDGFEFNYHLKKMLPYPTFWMDTKDFDTSDFITGIGSAFTGGGFSNSLPSSRHAFDRNGIADGFFGVHHSYIYLFNSGVRDFYVESDVNTDLRDWGEPVVERHYDPNVYGDLPAMFSSNPDVIKAGNYFKYDYSLSITKSFAQMISWAHIQPINYDPIIYEMCYVHYKNRVIYSLPQQHELISDYWTIFLANNYKDFLTPVTSIKPINKSGAVFFFGTQSPQQVTGVDTLRLGSGIDVTIGTGVLFSQPMQNLLTAERSFETGSCQNRLSVINTSTGLYWMSQSTGNIYQYQLGGQLEEISGIDLNWWFAQYLPYILTQTFPAFELQDNPVMGIGCQTTFDQQNTMVYFMKKDFKLRDGFVPIQKGQPISFVPKSIQYLGVDNFLVGGLLPIKLGDPVYFEDASWCASFDPKTKEWISFHDFRPELCMQGKSTFLTTQTDKGTGQGGLWSHNNRCDLYCNYYGVDFPFEVEYRVVTGQETTVLRSLEHQVEVYIYDPTNCHDRYLSLSEYFDRAVVFNQEQVSGYLNLVLTPTNDPWSELAYPIINPNSIDILYSKVEGKYRWNQFGDYVDDRGEFSNARRMIWHTAANGYIKTLNPLNINYLKDSTQVKRIRGYNSSVWLQKKVCGKHKFLVILVNNKLLTSPR